MTTSRARRRRTACAGRRRARPGRRSGPARALPSTGLAGRAVTESEQAPRDVPDLHLLGALGDPVTPMVTIDVLKRHRPRVTDPAVNLDRPVGRLAHAPVAADVAHR